MGWPTTNLSFPSMSQTQMNWKRSLCPAEKVQQFEEQVSILVTWEDCAMADYMVSSGLAKSV